MKKLVLIIAIAVLPIMSYGQSIFDKFEDMDGVTSVVVNQKMFNMLANIEVNLDDKEDQEYFDLIKKITSLKVLTTGDASISADMKSKVNSYINSSQLEELMRIKDGDQTPSFAEPPFQPEPEAAKALVDKADLLDIPSFLDRRTPDQRAPGKFPTLKALGSGPGRKYPAEFERFWAAYPQRHTDTKAKAYTAWLKGVKAVGPDVLQTGAEAYANYCAAKDHPSKLVATWINDEGWTADYGAAGGGNGGEAQTPYLIALATWLKLEDEWKPGAAPLPEKPQKKDFEP